MLLKKNAFEENLGRGYMLSELIIKVKSRVLGLMVVQRTYS